MQKAFVIATVCGCLTCAEAAGKGSTAEGDGGSGGAAWPSASDHEIRDPNTSNAFYLSADKQATRTGSAGDSVQIGDRVALSYAHQHFFLGDVSPGQIADQDIVGAQIRLFGNAVYDQANPWPQVSVGMLYTHNQPIAGTPEGMAFKRTDDVEPYLAATKVWPNGLAGRSMLLDAALRYTRPNPFGVLGSSDHNDARCLCFETSGEAFLDDHFVTGLEWRRKPNLLNAFQDKATYDSFVAWVPSRRVSFTAAYADFGNIAGHQHQQGPFLSFKLNM